MASVKRKRVKEQRKARGFLNRREKEYKATKEMVEHLLSCREIITTGRRYGKSYFQSTMNQYYMFVLQNVFHNRAYKKFYKRLVKKLNAITGDNSKDPCVKYAEKMVDETFDFVGKPSKVPMSLDDFWECYYNAVPCKDPKEVQDMNNIVYQRLKTKFKNHEIAFPDLKLTPADEVLGRNEHAGSITDLNIIDSKVWEVDRKEIEKSRNNYKPPFDAKELLKICENSEFRDLLLGNPDADDEIVGTYNGVIGPCEKVD